MDQYYGEILVNVARKVIEAWVKTGRRYRPRSCPAEFRQRRGVFTTLYTYPGKNLRGCIGYPEPIMPLIDALVESSVSACGDPRFPSLTSNELSKVTVEVSVLTKPELIRVSDPSEYPSKIKLGEDGLIIEKGMSRGLLLPQVALEWEWNQEMFLGNLCVKASLSPNEWRLKGVKIYRFQSDIFAEELPSGPVKKIERKVTKEQGMPDSSQS
ncbi:MAG: TIGR00296 family protein [Candidatus Aenigmarchaeota archaeon]|nr:TIGR00296 family protein [Candidatus Aenigmarchaeota archaeon]